MSEIPNKHDRFINQSNPGVKTSSQKIPETKSDEERLSKSATKNEPNLEHGGDMKHEGSENKRNAGHESAEGHKAQTF